MMLTMDVTVNAAETVSGGDAIEMNLESSLEDLIGETQVSTVDVVLNLPGNCTVSKDGEIYSLNGAVSLTNGTLTISQPVEPEYQNRIVSDIYVEVAAPNVNVFWCGNQISGSATDELGNVVTWDGTTLTIINSDKLLDTEEDDDDPEVPDAIPADYTVNYYVNSVETNNLLHTDVYVGLEGDVIDLMAIELNKMKPANTEALLWNDGVMVTSVEFITADNSDVINIVYTSEPVVIVAEGDFVVRYYKDSLTPNNFLGENKVNGNIGENINYATINCNQMQPSDYGNGEIQTVVSATIVMEGDIDVVYVLYTKVNTIEKIVTQTIEVPVEVIIEKIVEIPVEKIVEKIVEKEVIVEVPVEKIVEKEVIVEVPVEKIIEKEVIKEVPVEKIVEKEVIVEVPVEKIVEKVVEVPVETIIEKEVIVEVPVEKIVEKIVEVPTDKIIEKIVEVEKVVEVPVETIIEKEVIKEVPVEKIVYVDREVIVPEKEIVYVEVLPDPEEDEDIAENPDETPQTGDNTNVFALVGLSILSLIGCAIVLPKKKEELN